MRVCSSNTVIVFVYVSMLLLGCDSSLSECPWHCVIFSLCASRADAGHLSSGVADMVRQGMGRCAKMMPASTSDLLALDQHACAIQPANTPLYAAGTNSKPCPAPCTMQTGQNNREKKEETKTRMQERLSFWHMTNSFNQILTALNYMQIINTILCN